MSKGQDNIIAKLVENVEVGEFLKSLETSEHPLSLGKWTEESLQGFKCFKVSRLDIGFAISPSGEICALHNNTTVGRIGSLILRVAVNNGGTHLNYFDDPYLTELYSTSGFVEYERYPFDPQYDEGGRYEARYGRRDVVFARLEK